MANNLFEEIVELHGANGSEKSNAIRETMHIFALAGLNRGGFFEHAAFYGDTCLRVYYGLDRFSEDMDFSLLSHDETFSLEKYFDAIIDEFALAGRKISIQKRKATGKTAIESAFLKDDTQVFDLSGELMPNVKIKIEIDTNPPPGFETEYSLSMSPYSFMARCYSLPSSFAGKMSALLYRTWRGRIKGRDWYDFEWYVRKGVAMNLSHFNERAIQFGKTKEGFTPETFKDLLRKKINSTDIELAKEDVVHFISDKSKLDIWDTYYFLQVAELMKIE